jgi:hypothetical protein
MLARPTDSADEESAMTETKNQRPVGACVYSRLFPLPIRSRLNLFRYDEGRQSFVRDGVTVVGTLTMTIIEPRLYRMLAGWRRPSRGYRKHIRKSKAARK